MAGLYGDFVAKTISQGYVAVPATSWVPLTATGSGGSTTGTTPLNGRRHIRLQVKSNPGGALAVDYVLVNADGTYTTPTTQVQATTIYPGNTTVVEPIGDTVQVFGRLVKKKGFTDNHIRVVVTELA